MGMGMGRSPGNTTWICGVAGVLVLAAQWPAGAERATPLPLTRERHDALRAEARNRPRRILFTNDGGDATTSEFDRIDPPASTLSDANMLHAFLHSRRRPPDDGQIDTLFYCTSSAGVASHRSRVQMEHSIRRSREQHRHLNLVPRMHDMGTDPLEQHIALCRARGIEIFHTMRMNDTHDAGFDDEQFSDFKLAHPEVLFGTREERPPHGAWSAWDFGSATVRDFLYEALREVAENYEVDGLELDFFRHPQLFRSVAWGGRAGDGERAALTELMVRIRAMLDETGMQRGRPILLAVRAPDAVDYCRAIGIDLERWFELGLVDLFTGSCYFRLNEWRYGVELARAHGVPFFAGLSEARLRLDGERDPRRTSLEAYRGRAMEAWNAGVDGIYTFNLSNASGLPHYRELGSPETLRGLNRLHFVTVRHSSGRSYSNPGQWVSGGEEFINRLILTPHDPLVLDPGESVAVPFHNATDDLPAAVNEGLDPRVTCRVWSTQPQAVRVNLRGRELEQESGEGEWTVWRVPLDLLQPGVNRFELSAQGPDGAPARVRDVVLSVEF